MKMKLLLVALIALVHGSVARAALQTKEVTYNCKGVTLKGYLAWDDTPRAPNKIKRPGVLIVHEWWGLNDYARKRAEELAKMGYVAFACDMYGDGKTTQHPKEAGEMATEVRKNVETWRARALAGLKILQDHEAVDSKKIAAIGYCFGGSTALQLAYTGADVSAVVSFHGALPVPEDDQVKNIKAKILICHGALDSFIPEKTIQQVRSALDNGKVDYEMIYYGGAVHSFTVPDADKHGIKGIAYNREADRRSWMHMQMLFREVFGKTK